MKDESEANGIPESGGAFTVRTSPLEECILCGAVPGPGGVVGWSVKKVPGAGPHVFLCPSCAERSKEEEV